MNMPPELSAVAARGAFMLVSTTVTAAAEPASTSEAKHAPTDVHTNAGRRTREISLVIKSPSIASTTPGSPSLGRSLLLTVRPSSGLGSQSDVEGNLD